MVIESNKYKKDKTIFKVLNSINIDVGKLTLSLVLQE